MRRLFDGGIIILIAIFVLAIGGSQVHKFSNKSHHTGNEAYRGHDDILEENAEATINLLSGMDLDLTPESPEE